MTRTKITVELVVCDLCGREDPDATAEVLELNGEKWQIDTCATCRREIVDTVLGWGARPIATRKRSTAKQTERRWSILEAHGFARHRGRLSADEQAVLHAAGET